MSGELIMRVVCAWCDAVLVDAPPENGTSHAICASCVEKWETQSKRYDAPSSTHSVQGEDMTEKVAARARAIAFGKSMVCKVLLNGRIEVTIVEKRKVLDTMEFDGWPNLLFCLDRSVRFYPLLVEKEVA